MFRVISIIVVVATVIQFYTYDPSNWDFVQNCRVRGGKVVYVDGKLTCISGIPVKD